MEEEEEDGFKIHGRNIGYVDTGQDGEGMGNHCERCVEVGNSVSWGGMLILVNPVSEGITDAEGESAKNFEGDINGSAENESGEVIKVGVVVVLEGGGKGDSKMENILMLMDVCNIAAPYEDEKFIREGQ